METKRRCYDCQDYITTKQVELEVLHEPHNPEKMCIYLHPECWERVTYGGKPVYPERNLV